MSHYHDRWMEGWIDRIPGVKAFLSIDAVKLIGSDSQHRQQAVVLLVPERGYCRKATSDTVVQRNIQINQYKPHFNVHRYSKINK